MGFSFVPSQAASYAEIAPADNGRASAIFSTQRQMSASLGVALMATVLASFTTLERRPRADPRAGAHGYHWTFALCVGLALVAAAARVLMIRDEDAARRCAPATPAHAASRRRRSRLDARRTRERSLGRVSRAVGVVAQALLALGDRAGGDALEGGERAALVGRDPHVDHRRLVVLDERRRGTCRRRW